MNGTEWMFFYRYEDGTEGFGFYDTEEEANGRLREFRIDTRKYSDNIKVQFGTAQILQCEKNYIKDL